MAPEAGHEGPNPAVAQRIQIGLRNGFSEWTRDGRLRHPRYLGLRTDKKPDEVVRETH
jgi:bifunctional non-homologous end joining protein LigD